MQRFMMLIVGSCILLGCNKIRNWKYNPPNVLLISIEGLDKRLSCYGDTVNQTPHIDRLAARALIFNQATAQGRPDGAALYSIFNGQAPETMGSENESSDIFPELIDADYEVLLAHFGTPLGMYAKAIETEEITISGNEVSNNSAVTRQVLAFWESNKNLPFFVNAHYQLAPSNDADSLSGQQKGLMGVDEQIGLLLDGLMDVQEASNTLVALVGLGSNELSGSQGRSTAEVPFLYYDFKQDSSFHVNEPIKLLSLFATIVERCLENESLNTSGAPSVNAILEKLD